LILRKLNSERIKEFGGDFANVHHAAMDVIQGFFFLTGLKRWLQPFLKRKRK